MNPAVTGIESTLFVQLGLPVLIGLIIIGWWQNKHIDAMFQTSGRRLDGANHGPDQIEHRLERIEGKLDNHAGRRARLEERTSLIRS